MENKKKTSVKKRAVVKKELTTLAVRIDSKLYKKFQRFCKKNESSVSEQIRAYVTDVTKPVKRVK